ncbi:MAG: hypothetical protein LAP87_11670 [Acidobacteriia bacterium]|nr:hypothetical protein [Terriglobia bacterium]
MRTGIVRITPPESRLDGTLLAICNDPNPFGAATVLLEIKGIGDGDRITVTGNDSTDIKGIPVICMTDAVKA